jgi:predicted outer membrane repeat protein
MGDEVMRWCGLRSGRFASWLAVGGLALQGVVSCGGDDGSNDGSGAVSGAGAGAGAFAGRGGAGNASGGGSAGTASTSGGTAGSAGSTSAGGVGGAAGSGVGGASGAGSDAGGEAGDAGSGPSDGGEAGEIGGGSGGDAGSSGGSAGSSASGGSGGSAGSNTAGSGGTGGGEVCPEGSTGVGCTRCLVYANHAGGNDADDGRTWANAKATPQAAIDAAFADAGKCDVWLARGTYAPTYKADPFGPANTATLLLRDGIAVYGGFAGGELALAQRSLTANPTIVSGTTGALRRVVTGAEGARLDGITLTGAKEAGLYLPSASMTVAWCTLSANFGNAIFLQTGTVTVEDSQFVGNQASFTSGIAVGGGIYGRTGSSIRVRRSSFRENTSFAGGSINRGAAIYSEGNVDVTDSEFLENTVSGNGASAGAVYVGALGERSFERCTFRGNSAENTGGALVAYNGSLLIQDSRFEANTAGDQGGALYTGPGVTRIVNSDFVENTTHNILEGDGGAVYADGTFEIVGGSFVDNAGIERGGALACFGVCRAAGTLFTGNSVPVSFSFGGAVYFGGDSADFVNCQFSNNDAGQFGGAIGNRALGASLLTVTNSTFYANHAGTYCGSTPDSCIGQGGALYNLRDAKAHLENSILWGNTSRTEAPEIYNETGVTLTIAHSNVKGSGFSGTSGNIDVDPRYRSTLAETLDLRLESNSPSVGTGNNALLPDDAADADDDGNRSETLPVDRAGNARVQGGTVDMGAYER